MHDTNKSPNAEFHTFRFTFVTHLNDTPESLSADAKSRVWQDKDIRPDIPNVLEKEVINITHQVKHSDGSITSGEMLFSLSKNGGKDECRKIKSLESFCTFHTGGNVYILMEMTFH